MESVFKAYDVRGLAENELSQELYYKIGIAFGSWLEEEGKIAIGWDARPTSEKYAQALMQGLLESGRQVVRLGMVSTDMVSFAVGHLQLAGGAMITASHNPKEYNGLKLCRSEARAVGLDNGLADIRDKALSISKVFETSDLSGIEEVDITQAWIDHVLSFIDVDSLPNLRLAVDAGNGVGGLIFAEIEPYLPFEIEELFFDPDGTFPNHEANPFKSETLETLVTTIRDKKLDGGIALDGDGDRAFLIDETGEIISGSVITAALTEYFLHKNLGGTTTYDVRVSKLVPEIAQRNGGKSIRTKVGHALIKQEMRRHQAIFGGEASGHYYFKDNWFADSGLIAILIALNLIGQHKYSLSEFKKHYTKYAAIEETNFAVKDTAVVISKISKAFKDKPYDLLDGLTVDIDKDTWFNIRASNTEPVLRLNAEAGNKAKLDSLFTQLKDLITTP